MTKKATRHSSSRSATAKNQPYLHRGMTMDEWVEYIGEGFETEPKTLVEIEAQSVQTGIRTSIFGGWLVYRGFSAVIKFTRLIMNILRRLKDMFHRKKKEEVAQLPPMQPVLYPPYYDPRLLPPPYQPQPPQPVQQQQQPVQQPAQPPAQPPYMNAYMPPRQPQQPEQPQQRHEFITNPINGIILFMKELDKRINFIEEDIYEIITRLNMVQGVTPMPEHRYRFASTKS